MESRFKTTSRSKYALRVHIVLVTRFRKPVISDRIEKLIRSSIEKLADSANFFIEATNFEHRNHLHLLISYPPKLAVSDLINILKHRSTYAATRRHSQFWSNGYFAESTGKISSAQILTYIENQD